MIHLRFKRKCRADIQTCQRNRFINSGILVLSLIISPIVPAFLGSACCSVWVDSGVKPKPNYSRSSHRSRSKDYFFHSNSPSTDFFPSAFDQPKLHVGIFILPIKAQLSNERDFDEMDCSAYPTGPAPSNLIFFSDKGKARSSTVTETLPKPHLFPQAIFHRHNSAVRSD